MQFYDNDIKWLDGYGEGETYLVCWWDCAMTCMCSMSVTKYEPINYHKIPAVEETKSRVPHFYTLELKFHEETAAAHLRKSTTKSVRKTLHSRPQPGLYVTCHRYQFESGTRRIWWTSHISHKPKRCPSTSQCNAPRDVKSNNVYKWPHRVPWSHESGTTSLQTAILMDRPSIFWVSQFVCFDAFLGEVWIASHNFPSAFGSSSHIPTTQTTSATRNTSSPL